MIEWAASRHRQEGNVKCVASARHEHGMPTRRRICKRKALCTQSFERNVYESELCTESLKKLLQCTHSELRLTTVSV